MLVMHISVRNIVGIACLCAWAFLVTGCGAGSPAEVAKEEKPPVAVEIAMAEMRSIRELLKAQGVFEASTGGYVKLAPVTAGRLAAVYVKEGDIVQAGQLVAKIDIRSQEGVVNQTKAALQAAQSQSLQSKLTYQAAEATQRTSVRLATLNLASTKRQFAADLKQTEFFLLQAEADLARLKSGARPQEIAQSKELVRQAQTEYDRLLAQAKRDASLLAKGFVSAKTAEDSQAAANNGVSALKAAQEALSLMKEGARREEIAGAQAKVNGARDLLVSTKELGPMKIAQAAAALDQAQQDSVSVAAKAQDAASAQSMVEQKKAESQVAGVGRDNGEIRATFAGRVLRRLHNPGDQVDSTTTVLEIQSSAGAKEFRCDVAARDALRLKVGQEALIEIPGRPEAVVGQVASLAQVDPQTGLLSVRISLIKAPEGIPAGLYTIVRIVTHRFPSAIVVPKLAVVSHDAKSSVYVAKDGVAHRIDVELGPEDNGFVMIRSGVKLGDQVITLGQNELDDGAKVEPAKPEPKGAAQSEKAP